MTNASPQLKKPGLGPKGVPVLGVLPLIWRDPLGFLTGASRDYGHVVPLKLGRDMVYMINHPDLIRRIFQDNRDNYVRSKYYGHLSPILGEGLFTLEGKGWQKQRQAAQPSVSGPNLKKMVAHMVNSTQALVGRIREYHGRDEAFDMSYEAAHLTLDVVMRSFFSNDLTDDDAKTVYRSLTALLREVERRMWTFFPVLDWLPTKKNRAFRAHVGALDAIVYRLINERLDARDRGDDLLGMLILMEEAAGFDDNSRKSLRDQVISVLLAGHETGANSLAWLTCMLSKYPGVANRVAEEAEAVLDGSPVDIGAIGRLTYTRAVFKEILRLYPPAWTMTRAAVEEDNLNGFVIPKGGTVMLNPYVMHRHPGFWDNPEGFDPDRFLDQRDEERLKYAFFPFGGGPHVCLGNRFAEMEGTLTLAILAKEFALELVPGQILEPVPMTTLRPGGPVIVRARRRQRKTTQRLAA